MAHQGLDTIGQFHMLPPGANIVVGVSGGADSVALLHRLLVLQKDKGWQLQVVHVHHGLRGDEAERDCQFVMSLCETWQVPCGVFRFDVRAEGAKRGLGLEETGRLLRYECFRKVAKGGWIAVAHHQGDQGETLLMRLCRGTGLLGPSGMRPVQGDVARPLLFVTRGEIEGYCQENQLDYCEDSTNEMTIYTRNRIRHELIPLMEEIHPKAGAHLAKTATYLAEDEDYLQTQAREAYQKALIEEGTGFLSLSKAAMKAYHPSIKKRVWRRAFEKFEEGNCLSAVHFALLEKLEQLPTGRSLQFPGGMVVKNAYDLFILERAGNQSRAGFSYELKLGQEIYIAEAGFFVSLVLSQEKNAENLQDCCTNVFDYDKIKNSIFCRTRNKGDILAISGGHKKLKDYFIDEKIPRQGRETQPLIACGEEILWVVDKRCSSDFTVETSTKQFLIVQIRRST